MQSRLGEFFLYDEYDARRIILFNNDGSAWKTGAAPDKQYFLNLVSNEGQLENGPTSFNPNGTPASFGYRNTDGNDFIFGDLGNDWQVGGTGKDTIWDGWGNDLANADDVLTTNGGLNDTIDTHPVYEDRVFGGAGLDVLIGNTGGDRLIDWVGEWNSYIVPFSPFGIDTVSRQVEPQLPEFLYALSASQGADPTRDTDTGNSAVRNGEPDGELGLIIQQDHGLWQDQTGGPTDPQPGNIPGGKRDVKDSADFNNGTMNAFKVDSGAWEVKNGALSVGAASLGKDAAAVFHTDAYTPVYYEIAANVTVQKATGGWKSNAYLIFDYFSPTDFKFAGIDISINKLVTGYRGIDGWHVTAQGLAPGSLKYDTAYSLLVAVNGTTVTVQINGKLSFTANFAPRVINGEAYGLNKGFIGFGSDNSRGTLDNFKVQVLPPQAALDTLENYDDGLAQQFTGDKTGTWSVTGGRYESTATANISNISSVDLGRLINPTAYLELQANVKTNAIGGLIFDEYALDRYKFTALDVASQRVVIGHVDPQRGFVIDSSVAKSLSASTDYTMNLIMKGTSLRDRSGEWRVRDELRLQQQCCRRSCRRAESR